jgi:hypothetical protein
MPAGFALADNSTPIHGADHRSRNNAVGVAAIFGIFCKIREPVEATGVSYSGTSATGKLPPSIRFPTDPPETFQ